MADSLTASPTVPQLRSLYAGSYTDEDLLPLQHSSHLTRLRMKDRPQLRSLRGLERLRSLEHLGVYLAPGLDDFAPLGETAELRELHLQLCPPTGQPEPNRWMPRAAIVERCRLR